MNYQSLKARILQIFNRSIKDDELKERLQLMSQAGKKLLENRKKVDFDPSKLKPYSYRVFDTRYFYSENMFLWRSVEELQKHFVDNNIALVTTKLISGTSYKHIFVTEHIGDYSFVSNRTREVNYYFPLYLYQKPESPKKKSNPGNYMLVFDEKDRYKIKVPNFRQEILKHLNESYKQEICPEEIFNYIYAILYALSYREQYNEFLKIDFPRISFTDDFKLFKKLGDLGKELIELHLLKSPSLKNSFVKFPVKGTDRIDKVIYDKRTERIYINEQQYFECISEELWEYYIGSYQVLEKWLKDRSGRKLSLDEIDHYFKIAMALKETIEIQNKINKIFQEIEK